MPSYGNGVGSNPTSLKNLNKFFKLMSILNILDTNLKLEKISKVKLQKSLALGLED